MLKITNTATVSFLEMSCKFKEAEIMCSAGDINISCNFFLEPGELSGIAVGYGLNDQGFESWHGPGTFLFTTLSRPVLGPTQPPNQWVQGALSLGLKLPGRNHSPPSDAEVKNA
jgi:hypothetical protein